MSNLIGDSELITHASLVGFRRRGLRNGNWKHLTIEDKALFRCAFWVTTVKGKISNTKLAVQVLKIVVKLVERVPSAILRPGRRRTALMFAIYEKPLGVFSWAPQVREWLNDSRYVSYLGALGVNS
jgi:hypothetical protein